MCDAERRVSVYLISNRYHFEVSHILCSFLTLVLNRVVNNLIKKRNILQHANFSRVFKIDERLGSKAQKKRRESGNNNDKMLRLATSWFLRKCSWGVSRVMVAAFDENMRLDWVSFYFGFSLLAFIRFEGIKLKPSFPIVVFLFSLKFIYFNVIQSRRFYLRNARKFYLNVKISLLLSELWRAVGVQQTWCISPSASLFYYT